MIALDVPAKYQPIIEAEAKARNLTVQQLFFVAISDYLPRGSKTPEGRQMPLNIHTRDQERDEVVEFANAAGETVNFYVRRAVSRRVLSEKKNGTPWPSRAQKLAMKAEQQARAAEMVEAA
jgi:hypothetical protein